MKAFPFQMPAIHMEGKKTVALFVLFAISISVLQDFLNSYLKVYPFFLSESLLFKVFWILFFPLLLAQIWVVRNYSEPGAWRILSLPFLGLFIIPILIHLPVFPFLVFAVSAILFNHTYPYLSTLEYTVREDFYIYLAVYGIGSYFFTRHDSALKPTGKSVFEEEANPYPNKLMIRDGRKNRSIPVEEVLYISSANPYISIHTDKSSHLQLTSLKSILNTLPPSLFVRVHKSTIVNIKKVNFFRSRLNGDFDLHMSDGQILRLSRNYAQAFKRCFGDSSA